MTQPGEPSRPDTWLAVDFAGEQLWLLPERAVFWPRTATLWIADPHFGKAATFRAFSLPVPAATTGKDLDRLSRCLEQTAARRLVVLGDFFHARQGRSSEVLEQLAFWRDQWPQLEIVLVRGNHDRQAGDPPKSLAIETVAEPWELPPLLCRHHPDEAWNGFSLAGHLHPGVRLTGQGRQSERLRCFWRTQRQLVLPAFGSFTGCGAISPNREDGIYVIAEDRVMAVSASVRRVRK